MQFLTFNLQLRLSPFDLCVYMIVNKTALLTIDGFVIVDLSDNLLLFCVSSEATCRMTDTKIQYKRRVSLNIAWTGFKLPAEMRWLN